MRARAVSGQRYGYGSEVVSGLNQKAESKKKKKNKKRLKIVTHHIRENIAFIHYSSVDQTFKNEHF